VVTREIVAAAADARQERVGAEAVRAMVRVVDLAGRVESVTLLLCLAMGSRVRGFGLSAYLGGVEVEALGAASEALDALDALGETFALLAAARGGGAVSTTAEPHAALEGCSSDRMKRIPDASWMTVAAPTRKNTTPSARNATRARRCPSSVAV
jgi:hypothetical protein